jgi:hypothetical protein
VNNSTRINAGDYIVYNGYQNAKYKVHSISYTGPEPLAFLRKLSCSDTKIEARIRVRPLAFCVKTDPPAILPEQAINYIYVLFDYGSKQYKIGRSIRPNIRLGEHRVMHKGLVEVLCEQAPISMERILLKMFKNKLARPREWFWLDSEDIKRIKELLGAK